MKRNQGALLLTAKISFWLRGLLGVDLNAFRSKQDEARSNVFDLSGHLLKSDTTLSGWNLFVTRRLQQGVYLVQRLEVLQGLRGTTTACHAKDKGKLGNTRSRPLSQLRPRLHATPSTSSTAPR